MAPLHGFHALVVAECRRLEALHQAAQQLAPLHVVRPGRAADEAGVETLQAQVPQEARVEAVEVHLAVLAVDVAARVLGLQQHHPKATTTSLLLQSASHRQACERRAHDGDGHGRKRRERRRQRNCGSPTSRHNITRAIARVNWCVSFFFDLIVLIFVFSVSSNLTQIHGDFLESVKMA